MTVEDLPSAQVSYVIRQAKLQANPYVQSVISVQSLQCCISAAFPFLPLDARRVLLVSLAALSETLCPATQYHHDNIDIPIFPPFIIRGIIISIYG